MEGLAGGELGEDNLGGGCSLTENSSVPGTCSLCCAFASLLLKPWVCHSDFSTPISPGRPQDEAVCTLCCAQGDLVDGTCTHESCSCSIASRDPKVLGVHSPSCPKCQASLSEKHSGHCKQQEGLQMASLRAWEPLPQCERHMKQLRLLFCEDHGETICLICSLSQEHRGHQVRPIEEAALEYKVSLPDWGPFPAGHLDTLASFSNDTVRLVPELAFLSCKWQNHNTNQVSKERIYQLM